MEDPRPTVQQQRGYLVIVAPQSFVARRSEEVAAAKA